MGKEKKKVVFNDPSESKLNFFLFITWRNTFRILLQGERGAATNYISRNQALKKLQVSLPDFRWILSSFNTQSFIYLSNKANNILLLEEMNDQVLALNWKWRGIFYQNHFG